MKDALCARAAVAASATTSAAPALRRARRSANASSTNSSGQIEGPAEPQPVPATIQTAGSLRAWQTPETQNPLSAQSASAAQEVRQELAPHL